MRHVDPLKTRPSISDDVPALAQSLADTLGHPVDLTVVYVPRIRVQANAGDIFRAS